VCYATAPAEAMAVVAECGRAWGAVVALHQPRATFTKKHRGFIGASCAVNIHVAVALTWCALYLVI